MPVRARTCYLCGRPIHPHEPSRMIHKRRLEHAHEDCQREEDERARQLTLPYR